MAATQAHTVRTVQKPSALAHHHVPTGEQLDTPDHMDQVSKQKTASVRKALLHARQRSEAVATTPAANGVAALSVELQITNGGTLPAVTTADAPDKDTAKTPTIKRRRIAIVSPLVVPATVSVPPGPPQKKCQGCVHGDVLEMKMMEPRHIKHYLKKGAFLEFASCAGDCTHTIRATHQASPKAKLYFCDETLKGFHAPEEDPLKADMECGLILCAPCRAIRAARYELANATEGDGCRRTSRRGNKS